MIFFAVITDDDFNHAPMPRLIASSPIGATLSETKWFDPYKGYSRLVRTSFQITQGPPIPLLSTIHNQPISAHICQIIPI